MNGSDLAVLQFASLGEALQSLNSVSAVGSVQLIEMIPCHNGATLIFSGPKAALEIGLKRVVGASRLQWIGNYDPRVLRALYSLDNASIDQGLLVIESAYAGDLLQSADQALKKDLSVVDLKIPRGGNSGGYLLITSRNAESLKTFVPAEGSRSSLVLDVHPSLARYFDLTPKM